MFEVKGEGVTYNRISSLPSIHAFTVAVSLLFCFVFFFNIDVNRDITAVKKTQIEGMRYFSVVCVYGYIGKYTFTYFYTVCLLNCSFHHIID